MYILIFEPHKGCKKVFLDKNISKVNLGKSLRNGYKQVQLSADFLPDYVGIIIYHENKFFFRSYGKIKIFVNNKQLNDSSMAVRISHGSMIKIQYSENKNVYIGCIDNDIDNKWRVLNQNEHKILDVKRDKKGYIIENAEDIIFHGRKMNSKYLIPKDGDIFIKDDYIFYSMNKNIFFEKLKEVNLQNNNVQIKNPKKRTKSKNVAILMKGVTRYDKKKKWYRLKNVNLEINSGRLVAIMGVSGAGKSTLFDSILGNLKLDSGSIKIAGNELGHVPQFSVLRKGNTVQETMEYYASKKLKNCTIEVRRQKIDDLLNKLNLSLFKQSLVGRLSGGQSRRLDIAVQLLNEPKVILMDEPDSGLDVKSCIELYEILADLVEDKNSTILVITHNTHMACKYPYIDDLLFMASQGRICFYGEKNSALNYFNISDLDHIYTAVENNQDHFVQKYNNLIGGRI